MVHQFGVVHKTNQVFLVVVANTMKIWFDILVNAIQMRKIHMNLSQFMMLVPNSMHLLTKQKAVDMKIVVQENHIQIANFISVT